MPKLTENVTIKLSDADATDLCTAYRTWVNTVCTARNRHDEWFQAQVLANDKARRYDDGKGSQADADAAQTAADTARAAADNAAATATAGQIAYGQKLDALILKSPYAGYETGGSEVQTRTGTIILKRWVANVIVPETPPEVALLNRIKASK